MKAKIFKKGVPVFIKVAGEIQGTIIDSMPFMYHKQLCVRLVGFRNYPIYLRRLEAI